MLVVSLLIGLIGDRVVLSGKVVPLADALKGFAVVAEEGPITRQVALVGEDGAVTPLLMDEASKALFKDPRLHRRQVRIDGRLRRGLPYLQVLNFQIWQEDRFRTPEYWCEVCSISYRYDPENCPCCQGPMVLRMKLEEKAGPTSP